MKLVSFDIFDTVLIRKCGLPENIFYLLANKLYPNNQALREAFLLWRRQAEQQARYRFPRTDVSLEQIYSDDTLSGFTGYTSQQMMEAEIQVESENLIANPAIKKLIEKKREQGYCICFISDMYLGSHTLINILQREGCLLNDEKVYVSCEYNARKSNGLLFDIVRKEVQPYEWLHFGDHPVSDVKMPQRKGIRATQVHTEFTETERMLLAQKLLTRNRYELSILTGLQRAARICYGNDAYKKIASDFVASAYIPYAYFLMEQAQQRGLKRLYFLSRDSYVLMKMAEVLQSSYPTIELRYLFVSRKSLLLPYLTEMNAKQYLAVQDHQSIYSKKVDELLADFETSREEQKNTFDTTFDYNRIGNRQQETDFLNKIFGKESRYLPVLRERASKRRTLLHAYFEQEGLFDGTPSGMVDVGWLGTSRLMINSILKDKGIKPTEFFYLGVRNDALPVRYGIYSSYYRPEQLSTSLTTLVENYFSASPYPSTLNYKQTEQGVMPVFTTSTGYQENDITSSNVSIAQWIMQEMGKNGLHFTDVFWSWSQTCINAISTLSCRIDLTPFVKAADFDDTAFVRRLTFIELLRLVCFGEHITAYDRASLQLTVYQTIDAPLWKLHSYMRWIRHYLYVRLRK